MIWHTATVALERFASLLAEIRRGGGTVARSIPAAGAVQVTWTTVAD